MPARESRTWNKPTKVGNEKVAHRTYTGIRTLFSVALAIKIDSYSKIIQSAHIRKVSYDSNHRQAQIY